MFGKYIRMRRAERFNPVRKHGWPRLSMTLAKDRMKGAEGCAVGRENLALARQIRRETSAYLWTSVDYMPSSALYALVLFAALTHAAWNAMVKGSSDRLLMLTSIRVVGFCAGLLVASLVPRPEAESIPFLLAATAVHYLYYFLILNIYRVGDLSQVYPIARGSAPLLVALLAAVLADEVLGAQSVLAIAVLSTGILMLTLSGRAFNRKAVGLALLTGVSIAGYSVLSGMGTRCSGSLLGYIAWLEIATGAGMVVVAYVRRRKVLREYARTQWRTGLVAGLLSVSGYAIALWAMSILPMASVVALRETSVVFGAMIGSIYLGEGFAARRSVAAATVLLGVVLLSLGAKAA